MNLTTRKADISDVKIISALGITTFYEAYFLQDDSGDLANYVLESFSVEKIEREIADKDSTFFIAEADGCAVGYAKLRENAPAECVKGENAVEIQRVYILEKMRGKSVGDALMRKCFAEARRKKYESVWLGVWEENLAAQRFYKKYGFEKVGELYFPYGETVGTNHVLKLDLDRYNER
jgi:ribosomal protein S18 acetylase RimI-like enzyme